MRTFKVILISVTVLGLQACCSIKQWRYASPPDKLEVTGIVEFYGKAKCPIPGLEKPILLNTREEIGFWFRLVFANRVKVGAGGREVEFDLVDSFGDPSLQGKISSSKITTGSDGYVKEELKFVPSEIGVYRIRAKYRDKNAVSITYSPPIIVSI